MLRRRVILLVPLLALLAFVATTEKRAEAADVASLVEGENFDVKPTGTSVVTSTTLYSNGQALKFTNNTATATETVNFASQGDVVLVARGGQSGGSPTLSVNVDGGAFSPAQAISNNGAPVAYTYDLNVPAGSHTIGVRAGNTGLGRYPFLDYVTFPASGGGGTVPGGDLDADGVPDASDNCPDVYNPGQRDDDGDGVGNKCEGGSTSPPPGWNCTGKQINQGDDIDAIINNDPSGTPTRFCVHAGTYQVSAPARLRAGDKLDAEPGRLAPVGPATQPTPVVKLVGSGTENLLSAIGTGISITWVDLSGASGTGTGAGSAIAAGSAGSDFLVQYSRIHNNDSVGISNMHGQILDSEFFSNSEDPASIGFNASAVKGVTEYEAGKLFVHDEQGNGLWCDHGCDSDPGGADGFWVHDSVVVNSDRAGVRYEDSPNKALIEYNELHGNGRVERRGGVDIRDSQNATVRNNIFGPATIAGVSYLANGDRIGVRATDSGRSDRVDLSNVDVVDNNMNGDRIVTCGGPVVCAGNTNVGTR
jgi:hypothetical protein